MSRRERRKGKKKRKWVRRPRVAHPPPPPPGGDQPAPPPKRGDVPGQQLWERLGCMDARPTCSAGRISSMTGKDRYGQTEQSGGRKKRLLSVPALVQKRLGHAARPCTKWRALVDALWWRAPPSLPPIEINLALIGHTSIHNGQAVTCRRSIVRARQKNYTSISHVHREPNRRRGYVTQARGHWRLRCDNIQMRSSPGPHQPCPEKDTPLHRPWARMLPVLSP